MKNKIIIGVVTFIVAIGAWVGIAQAHRLDISVETSCVRPDGSWDWTASYSIPNEDWAQGLTVIVTWHPASSGTSNANFVNVSVDGAWSNGQQGGASTRINKGRPCPVQETTTTSTTIQETTTSTTSTTLPTETTTTSSVQDTTTSTPDSVAPTSTAPVTSTGSPTSTVVNPTTTVTGTPIVPVTSTPTAVNPPSQGLPATGSTAQTIAILAAVILGIGALFALVKYLFPRKDDDPKRY